MKTTSLKSQLKNKGNKDEPDWWKSTTGLGDNEIESDFELVWINDMKSRH